MNDFSKKNLSFCLGFLAGNCVLGLCHFCIRACQSWRFSVNFGLNRPPGVLFGDLMGFGGRFSRKISVFGVFEVKNSPKV